MPLATPDTSEPMCTLLRVSDGKIRMQARFGLALPRTSDGYGGWKIIDRPHKRSMTEWQGPQPFAATLQLLFDGHAGSQRGQSQNRSVAYLERHFAPTNGTTVPPKFRVLGAWPISESVHWVVQGVQVEDDAAITVVRRSDRVPLRTMVTLQLLQHVAGDVIVRSTASRRAKDAKGKEAGTRTYVVRKGDTLSLIAARQLGSAKRAGEIAKLNSIRDPKHLRVGARLKIPAS